MGFAFSCTESKGDAFNNSLPSLSFNGCASDEIENISKENPLKRARFSQDVLDLPPFDKQGDLKHGAALKLQKLYRSFSTGRQLADCAVLVEQRWWKLLDFALLKRSSVSFFDIEKPESIVSKWSRARTRAAKVGKGLSKNGRARKLALQHWLEAVDPRHRYGHNLQFYYECWLRCESNQPFFYWLDIGEGKEVNLNECPRTTLQLECIIYLGPREREAYEVIVEDGKLIYKNSRECLDTTGGPVDTKWIFVLSTQKNLYFGLKRKGMFHHSSFLAGGATSAAGRVVVEKGILKAVWLHSGHYRPTEENFEELMIFLKENNVDLSDVKTAPAEGNNEWGSRLQSHPSDPDLISRNVFSQSQLEQIQPSNTSNGLDLKPACEPKSKKLYRFNERTMEEEDSCTASKQSCEILEQCRAGSSLYKRRFGSQKPNLFLKRDDVVKEPIQKEEIFQTFYNKKGMKSCQLEEQMCSKWTTGDGPCFPYELYFQALEKFGLSPRGSESCKHSISPIDVSSQRPKIQESFAVQKSLLQNLAVMERV